MSVNESERGKGKFDVLIKANDLAVYTIRITKNPKIFLPEYQTALTNDIIHTAKEIFTKAWTANNIRVGDEPRNWLERKKLHRLVNKCKRGEITKEKVNVCYAGWRVHAEKGDSTHLLDRMDKYYKDLWKGAK